MLYLRKASFTHATKHTLQQVPILPILDIGEVIYKIASNSLLNKLDAVYHSAIRFVTKAPYTTTTATCMLSLAGPLFILVAKHIGYRSSKSFLGKAPLYLSSLVIIAAPT